MGCQGGEEASIMSWLQEHSASGSQQRRARQVGSAGPHRFERWACQKWLRRVRDEAIWSDTMSCYRHRRRLAVEASEEVRSGPRFSTDGREVRKWHERMVRRVFPARVWTRLSCVTGEKFSWSDS